MTPYEFALYLEAYQEKEQAEAKEKLTLVWLGEYYHRTKYLPSLNKELNKISSETKRVMSNEEMLQVAKRLNTQFGGTVKKGGE